MFSIGFNPELRTLNLEPISLGLKKLKEKKQTDQQQKQAVNEISIFYRKVTTAKDENFVFKNRNGIISRKKGNSKLTGANWAPAYNDLNAEIKIRHYSKSTLRTYSTWVRQF